MKILHVVTLMSPDGRYGGPPRVAETLARASATQGHDVVIAGGHDGFDGAPPRMAHGVRLRLFSVTKPRSRSSFAEYLSPQLWSWLALNSGRFDVIHLHLSRDLIMAISATIVRRAARKSRIILQTHGMIEPNKRLSARVMDAVAIRPILAAASSTLCLNETERSAVLAVEPTTATVLLRNGLLFDEPAPSPDDVEVLFLARLQDRKRPLQFLAMAEALVTEWPSVRFTLVGPDGGAGGAVAEKIEAIGSDRVTWQGPVAPDDVTARIARSSVYVLPAENEPFGLTIVEAMSQERPVVIAQSGGLAETVVEAGAGLTFDGSVAGLTASVRSLLENPRLRRQMGKNGRETVKARFSAEAVERDLREVYMGHRESARRPRVMWVTNLASPYRIPVWRSLSSVVDLDVRLLESNSRLRRDHGANRGADWQNAPEDGFAISELPTVRVARGEARYYGLLALPLKRPASILLGGWESPAYWQLLVLAKLLRVRTVGFYESTLSTQRHVSGPIGAMRGRFFRSLDAVVVPGPAAGDAILSLGVEPQRIHTGFNAVDVRQVNALTRAARDGSTEKGAGHAFVFVGQLIERKGIDLLVDAFAVAGEPDDTLTIVGRGDGEPDLRRRIERAGLADRVRFAGYVANADLPAILGSQHTLVMPSREEVWGLVANEALAAGLHVVVTDLSGVTPSIVGMNGVYVASPDTSSIADAMAASRLEWTGHIDKPEILDHGPEEFAAVFAGALVAEPRMSSTGDENVRATAPTTIAVLSGHDSRRADDFNGTPGLLIAALRRAGVDAGGARLTGPEYSLLRPIWAGFTTVLERSIARGYQYSAIVRAARSLRFAGSSVRGAQTVVSLYQNPPSTIRNDADLVMYVDGTLKQLFDTYPELSEVHPGRRRRALSQERASYSRARLVLTKTHETQGVLRDFYAVPASKIRVIPPPPNVDIAEVERIRESRSRAAGRRSSPVTFVAIARDFERKNVGACIDLVAAVNRRGVPAELHVVGLRREDIPVKDLPDWVVPHGVLTRDETAKMASILADAHIGLLMSSAEIAGIALLEYQAAGLLVACSGAGGMRDVLLTEYCTVVDPTDQQSLDGYAREVVSWVESGTLPSMLENAWGSRTLVPTWDDIAAAVLGQDKAT